jgi:hypothetical protein
MITIHGLTMKAIAEGRSHTNMPAYVQKMAAQAYIARWFIQALDAEDEREADCAPAWMLLTMNNIDKEWPKT